jgi:hypothetical protein
MLQRLQPERAAGDAAVTEAVAAAPVHARFPAGGRLGGVDNVVWSTSDSDKYESDSGGFQSGLTSPSRLLSGPPPGGGPGPPPPSGMLAPQEARVEVLSPSSPFYCEFVMIPTAVTAQRPAREQLLEGHDARDVHKMNAVMNALCLLLLDDRLLDNIPNIPGAIARVHCRHASKPFCGKSRSNREVGVCDCVERRTAASAATRPCTRHLPPARRCKNTEGGQGQDRPLEGIGGPCGFGLLSARAELEAGNHYMTQPLVELYGGCMVVLKVS